MSSLMVFACTGESSLERPAEPGGPVNQFRSSSQQALTLPDGGQCPITVNADAELMIRSLAVVALFAALLDLLPDSFQCLQRGGR